MNLIVSSEMFLGPVPDNFHFVPKHKAKAWSCKWIIFKVVLVILLLEIIISIFYIRLSSASRLSYDKLSAIHRESISTILKMWKDA
jgi:hypothetical protein